MADVVSTTRFYVPRERFTGERLSLPKDESQHAFTVLRARAGDRIEVVDGEGGWYLAELDYLTRQEGRAFIVEERRDDGEVPYALSLAVGLQRQPRRFEVLLEKATELGVQELIPLHTERTQRETIRDDRSHRVLVAAMKQCGRSRLMCMRPPRDVREVAATAGTRLVCHEAVTGPSLLEEVASAGYPDTLQVFIGPEGGFTDDEVAHLAASGARVVSLGPLRLRTETAATTAAAAILQAYLSR